MSKTKRRQQSCKEERIGRVRGKRSRKNRSRGRSGTSRSRAKNEASRERQIIPMDID